jgi:CRISPR/Cas system-associated exonuclease Cas4 (RecB family)
MKKRILSPTSINTYLRCPRKFYLRYIKGLKEKPSIHLFRGKAVHKSIARFSQIEIRGPPDMGEMRTHLIGIFSNEWKQLEPEIKTLGLPQETLNRFFNESIEMLSGWLKRHKRDVLNGVGKPETEVKLFSNTHSIMGIIDVIKNHNGSVCITDYKTSKNDKITQDIKVQMAIYALLYEENYPGKLDIVAIDFLKHQQEKRFRVTDQLIQFAINLCEDIHRKTSSKDTNDYPCKCGGWCEKDFIWENGRC